MRGLYLAASAAAMAMSARSSIEVRDDVRPTDLEVKPKRRPDTPRLVRQTKAVDDRDPNHPAVIAAQDRQRRKAARQAKGFVTVADGALEASRPVDGQAQRSEPPTTRDRNREG